MRGHIWIHARTKPTDPIPWLELGFAWTGKLCFGVCPTLSCCKLVPSLTVDKNSTHKRRKKCMNHSSSFPLSGADTLRLTSHGYVRKRVLQCTLVLPFSVKCGSGVPRVFKESRIETNNSYRSTGICPDPTSAVAARVGQEPMASATPP